jgi:hypothetical protein
MRHAEKSRLPNTQLSVVELILDCFIEQQLIQHSKSMIMIVQNKFIQTGFFLAPCCSIFFSLNVYEFTIFILFLTLYVQKTFFLLYSYLGILP